MGIVFIGSIYEVFFQFHRNDEAMKKVSYGELYHTRCSQGAGAYISHWRRKPCRLLHAMTEAVNVKVPRNRGDRTVGPLCKSGSYVATGQ